MDARPPICRISADRSGVTGRGGGGLLFRVVVVPTKALDDDICCSLI